MPARAVVYRSGTARSARRIHRPGGRGAAARRGGRWGRRGRAGRCIPVGRIIREALAYRDRRQAAVLQLLDEEGEEDLGSILVNLMRRDNFSTTLSFSVYVCRGGGGQCENLHRAPARWCRRRLTQTRRCPGL